MILDTMSNRFLQSVATLCVIALVSSCDGRVSIKTSETDGREDDVAEEILSAVNALLEGEDIAFEEDDGSTVLTIEEGEDFDDQFEGYGQEGLMADMPEGTTAYEGNMAGIPIEMDITKDDETYGFRAIFRDIKSGTTVSLDGESLPAMAGDICFYGKEGDTDWSITLTGTADSICGTAQGDGDEMELTLHKKTK